MTERKTEERKTEHETRERRTEHKTEKHKTEEHKTEEHKTEEHKTEEHKTEERSAAEPELTERQAAELRLPTREQLREAYERDLEPAFPPAELKPLREMLREWDRGEYRPWCLFEGGEIVGEAFVWTAVPGFALFDYLCVTARRRNGGLGSELVRRLAEAERGGILYGEAEIPRFAADPAMAERRLGFYRRCGARQADYDSCVFGVPYHTLYWAEREVGKEELSAAHAAAYRSSIPEPYCARYIQIPWEEPMGRPDPIPWFEGGENDEDTGL